MHGIKVIKTVSHGFGDGRKTPNQFAKIVSCRLLPPGNYEAQIEQIKTEDAQKLQDFIEARAKRKAAEKEGGNVTQKKGEVSA